MMNQGTSFLKRFFALVMALALLVSGSNLGAVLQVSAAEAKTITAGEIVANNYDLTEAEKNLLSSGLLAGEVVTYTVPDDSDLVAVDAENAKITAATEGEWIPVSADIVANGAVVETIALVNGEGNYDPAVGNAFSVKVKYVLNKDIDADVQALLLSAAPWLTTELAAMKGVYDGTDTDIGTVVLAMDTLEDLSAGIVQQYPGFTFRAQFKEPAQTAVAQFRSEMNANGGLLSLQVYNQAYYSAASKTEFLAASLNDYMNVAIATYNKLNAILNDPLMNNEMLDSYLEGSAPASYTQWKALKGILNNLVSALETVVGDGSSAWNSMAPFCINENLTSAQYLQLDALVAAIGEITPAAEIKNPLLVAEGNVQKNLSMFNVTVKVVMNNVVDAVDSAELETAESAPVVLTLAAGATPEEVAAEAAETIEAALAGWAAYAEGKFDVAATELPAALDADIEYVVTYSPKTFAITSSFGLPAELPYGYQLTLPAHTDPAKAYDYVVNGVAYAQGEVVVITEDAVITRTYGKAYTNTDLFTIIADNYGNEVVSAILKSGAVKGNEVISVRKPDPADASEVLYLFDGTLTADNYSAAYNGLNWAPYTYGAAGTENAFSGNTATWGGKSVKVQYKLTLTNFSEAKVAEILALAAALKTEGDAQKSTMDSFADNYDTMGMLDKTKLGALKGVISVTDLHADPAKNAELQAYFSGLVDGIINNNLAGNNLKIYNMLGQYINDGMRYYYSNAAAIIAEIESLASYLGGMLQDQEKIDALTVLVSAAGFPEYVDKIAELEGILNNVLNSLTVPNEAIDVSSKNLGKLIDALALEGEASYAAAGNPYLLSDMLTALDESQVMVQIVVDVDGNTAAVATDSMDRGTVISAELINSLKAQAAAEAAKLGNVKYYTVNVEGDLDALVGAELNDNFTAYFVYEPKEFVVKIDGEADQIVTINDLEIELPKHPATGYKYEYTVDGVSGLTNANYTFTLAQIDALFADGTYTITRIEINQAVEDLEKSDFAEWMVKDANGNVTGLYAAVEGDKTGIMDFVMTVVNAGYSYIGLNGEPLLYLNESNTLEICIQTLLNAVLNDNQFSNQTLINLGKNGKGEFVHATMQLGNAADDLAFEALDFTLYMNSVPAKMGTVANGLDKIAPYMTFNSNNGVMDVNINLPEKVYEVYLAGMLVTGNVTKDNMAAINDDIAFQFFYDYIETVINSDATTASFSNTLSMLGKPYDLTGYEDYYQLVKKALTHPGIGINTDRDDQEFLLTAEGKSQKAINALLNLLGMEIPAEYEGFVGMIKEYGDENATLAAAARANLVNTDSGFEAALVDLNASGIANKFDFTKDLPARCASIADKAAIILVDDVDGNLVFNGTTILDLNGQTVNGSITANGTLIIVDSFMGTANGGHVTGAVSGNVTIIAGTYDADVSKYLKDGYKQVNGSVQNALYTIESDGNDVTFVINTDVMSDETVDGYVPNVRAMAVDIAVDLILNYYTSAALTANDNTIYNLRVDDLVGLYASSNRVDDLIQVVLDCVNLPELSAFANIVLEDLLDFGAMADALESGEALATYTLSTTPWAVNVSYVADGDYITAGFGSNAMNTRTGSTFDVALKFVGSNKDRVVDELRELGQIVDASATVNLEHPIYDGASNSLYLEGSAKASAYLTLNQKDIYANILAIVLANGNADVQADLVAAVNANDREAMKAIIDQMTVADLFAAMKALNRNEDFAAVASKLGVSADVTEDTYLEKAAHLVLTALGKVLEELDITGMNSKFGALDTDGDGIYVFKASASRTPDVSRRGYTVYAEASLEVELTVNLFGEPCLWGDVNHDGVVDIDDAILIQRYDVDLPISGYFCTLRADVDGNGVIDIDDAILIQRYDIGIISKFPVEN